MLRSKQNSSRVEMENRVNPMQSPKKKKYVKPQIMQVKLDAQTAVLGFCKSTGGAGPNPLNGCITPTPACSSIGS